MKLPVILIIAILLIAGIFVELKAKQDHGHTTANHVVAITTTTKNSPITNPDPLLASEQHDACSDISRSEVIATIGSGMRHRSAVEAAVEVDPDWQKAPDWAGCAWAVYSKNRGKTINALELFVAGFGSAADATKFYHQQTSGYDGGIPARERKILTLGNKSLFLPQPRGGSGGQIDVVKGHIVVRVESLIKSSTVTKQRSVQILERLAISALDNVRA